MSDKNTQESRMQSLMNHVRLGQSESESVPFELLAAIDLSRIPCTDNSDMIVIVDLHCDSYDKGHFMVADYDPVGEGYFNSTLAATFSDAVALFQYRTNRVNLHRTK